jgi:hypothetical protein
VNTATAHDVTDAGGYALGSLSYNKFGMNRLYKYVGTGVSTTITVGNLGGSGDCTTDDLDLLVYDAGSLVAYDVNTIGAQAGCPTVTFDATNLEVYTVYIRGQNDTLPSYDITVTP